MYNIIFSGNLKADYNINFENLKKCQLALQKQLGSHKFQLLKLKAVIDVTFGNIRMIIDVNSLSWNNLILGTNFDHILKTRKADLT